MMEDMGVEEIVVIGLSSKIVFDQCQNDGQDDP